jgi:hypothetical protein
MKPGFLLGQRRPSDCMQGTCPSMTSHERLLSQRWCSGRIRQAGYAECQAVSDIMDDMDGMADWLGMAEVKS